MAEPALPPPADGPEATRGIVAELLGFASSLGRHIQALLALAGHESKEAAFHYLRVIAAAVVALVFVLLGYLFLLLFVAFLLAAALKISWIWIALGFAVLHFLVTAGCLFYVKARIQSPMFTATASEFKKDFDALSRFQP